MLLLVIWIETYRTTLTYKNDKRTRRDTMKNSNLNAPERIESNDYRFDFFDDGNVLHNKKKNHLPAMGWNSWNAAVEIYL